tara:strand:- start:38333 stop:38560 length:228 start_codon:yes stop_codon:yes gene_type:complete
VSDQLYALTNGVFHLHLQKKEMKMNNETALHVIWGVFNNPNTPESMKENIKERLQKAIENNDSKLAKKIAITVNS